MSRLRSYAGNRLAEGRAAWTKARQWRTRAGVCPPMGTGAHFTVRRALRKAVGLDIHLTPPAGYTRITKSTMAFEIDDEFNRAVDLALAHTGETAQPAGSESRLRQRQKLYTLLEAFDLTSGVDGLVAECGCYRGLSAYLLCRALATGGAGVHLFDSFEGLSAFAPEDHTGDPRISKGKVRRREGMFRASVDDVRRALAEFPGVELHPGWIPASLAGAPPGPYRFVHLDLDLHDPTLGGLEFFHPRLAPGGALLCDDYGSVRWPGVRQAVDKFCVANGVRRLRLSSGQALLLPSSGGSG